RSEVQYAGIAPNPAAAVQEIIDKRPVVHAEGIKLGAYDPHGDFGAQANVATEDLFLPWEDVDLETLRVADAYALARG
ncbi:glycosyl hydrolase family 5, partial [Rhizobium ruizarguesonis]